MFLFRSNMMYTFHTIHILDFSTWSHSFDNDNEIQSDIARVETRSHQ